jgi:ketosteroid isomerase-like protein
MLEELFAGPTSVSWEWDVVNVAGAGDVAWLTAEAALVLDGESARPYRITGVLERRAGRWLWALFHGSEPS